ncbi:Leucine rich repeat N-terminal domain [Musa troglodytarum]|uniref:Leucine rich repeat N-terminal domain n=1 Tax=Musa troglodytarum TaxID=320322 RepID=A0A9E7J8J7_9LILI|nr:Leucine rich repeat N-terminal domain [Musa troglodytarum]
MQPLRFLFFSFSFFFFFAFFSCIASTSGAGAADDEISALLAIKSGLVDPLNALRDWKAPADAAGSTHCNWTGVACGSLGFVERLDLSHLNLSGLIADDIRRLSSLEEFDVSVNAFVGRFPTGLGSSHALTIVNASANNFVGPLPEDLSNATSLEVVDFRGSFFQGSIPASYRSLQKLSIPAEFGNLSSLEYLDLAVGDLDGAIPPELGRLQRLTTLFLYKNNLEGDIPKEIGNMSALVMLDVSDNRVSGPIPPELAQLTNLQLLNLMCNRLQGPVPPGIGDLPRLEIPASLCDGHNLTKLILFNNAFSGPIPVGFSTCNSLVRGEIPSDLASSTSLSFIDLSHNHLRSSLPSTIFSIPTLQSFMASDNLLTSDIPDQFQDCPTLTLNLSYNNLSGPVPANGILRTIIPDDLAGNSGLCGGVLPPCGSGAGRPWPERGKSPHLKHIVAGWMTGISAVLAFCILLLGAHHLYRKWYVNGGGCCCEERFDEESGAWPSRLTAFQRLSFTSNDILACVKEANVIGMGATGIVYKAELPRPRAVVAVKKLWRARPPDFVAEAGNSNPEADIAGEVSVVGKLRHRNIVRLLGYMHNDTDAMILYEYMPNGSLWEALHGPQASRLLPDWVSRYNVAAGIAQGLAYLHHDCHPPVIHRDIKSNNILLNGNLEARIADFGLARRMPRKNETVSMVAGSYGYIAPEYGYTLRVDEKSDIYSFGVVLMELVTGRRPIEREFGECQDVVGWVRGRLRSDRGLEAVLDAGVGGQCKHVEEEMVLALRIAVLCTAKLPKERPSMRDVLTMLGEAKPRRKSSSFAGAESNAVDKDKPVFSTSPESGYL